MPTLKAMKKKVARKLRSAKKNVRKLSVRLNKLRRKTSHGKKKHKRRRRKRTRRRRQRGGEWDADTCGMVYSRTDMGYDDCKKKGLLNWQQENKKK